MKNLDLALTLLPYFDLLIKRKTNYIVFTKITNILKNMIIYHKEKPSLKILYEVTPEINFMQTCETLLEKILNPTEPEINCQIVGNLFMAYAEFFANKRSPEMMVSLISKLNKSSLPVTNQGIVVYLSFLIQSYTPDMLIFLSNLQVQKKNGLKILMDHWLLHQPKFAGKLSKLHTTRGLIHIYQ